MKLRIKKSSNVNEETRTVSGFMEFTHNGKDSINETTDGNDYQNFYTGKYSLEFSIYKKDLSSIVEYIKENVENVYNSLKNYTNEHKKFIEAYKSKLKIVVISKSTKDSSKELIGVCFYTPNSKYTDTAYILLPDVNVKEYNKDIYNYIIDVLAEKKLSNVQYLVILGDNELGSKEYYKKYEKIETNEQLLYLYINPYFNETKNTQKEENKDNNNGFDRSNSTNKNNGNKQIGSGLDDISKDNSKLTDKREKEKGNNDGIISAAIRGAKVGIDATNNQSNFIKATYNAYQQEKNNVKKYMY